MTLKHLIKNQILRKIAFFAMCVTVLLLAVLSVCTTSQASGQSFENNDFNEVYPTTSNADEYAYPILIEGGGGTVTLEYDETDFPELKLKKSHWSNNTSIYECVDLNEIVKLEATHFDYWQSHNGQSWTLTLELNAHLPGRSSPVKVEFSQECCVECDGWICKAINERGVLEKDNEKVPQYPEKKNISKNYYFGKLLLFEFPVVEDPSFDVSGVVIDAETKSPVPGKFVQYCKWDPIWGYAPVLEEGARTWTDFLGGYTLEAITEDMLPGKVMVYDNYKQIGESAPILLFPEGEKTLDMWPIIINQDQPEPPGPVPPVPPDPPVPPGPVPPEPVPPEPVPPVPPMPVPTPDNPGGGIAQTGDAIPFAPIVALFVVSVLGCGIALRKEF